VFFCVGCCTTGPPDKRARVGIVGCCRVLVVFGLWVLGFCLGCECVLGFLSLLFFWVGAAGMVVLLVG